MTCAMLCGPSSPATTPSGWSRRTDTAAQPRCAPPGRRRLSSAPHNAAYCPDSRVRYSLALLLHLDGERPLETVGLRRDRLGLLALQDLLLGRMPHPEATGLNLRRRHHLEIGLRHEGADLELAAA